MAQSKPKKSPTMRSLEERLRIAREVNAYREAHPEMQVSDVLKQMGLTTQGVKESSYWAWRKRLELADLTRKANGGDPKPKAEVQHFPLDAIPERAVVPAAKRTAVAKRTDHRDEDRELASALLEVATRLLKR